MRFSLILLTITLISGCSTTIPNDPALWTIDRGKLPATDVSANIKGLGPCTDNPDRTLHLSSQHPTIILAHGCYASAGRFRALAEVFAFHGQQTACFNYDDRDSLTTSSDEMVEALQQLGAVMENKQFTIIGHSQGGLISRKALVSEREQPLDSDAMQLRLVTISAPFSGITAASHCGSTFVKVVTLGLIIPICYAVSGDKWYEITTESEFIRQPGTLVPQVEEFLKIVTDERNTCRRYDEKGICLEDDFVFSVEEQYYSPIDQDQATGLTNVEVHAGHAEIVGDQRIAPVKLIRVLQQNGVMKKTVAAQQRQLENLLAYLYDLEPGPAKH